MLWDCFRSCTGYLINAALDGVEIHPGHFSYHWSQRVIQDPPRFSDCSIVDPKVFQDANSGFLGRRLAHVWAGLRNGITHLVRIDSRLLQDLQDAVLIKCLSPRLSL